MSTAIYYTNSTGATEGWNGVGGVPFFVVDTVNKTLRVPDVRGMFAEAAGVDSMVVGGVHSDAMRDVSGRRARVFANILEGGTAQMTGPYYYSGTGINSTYPTFGSGLGQEIDMFTKFSRTVPTAAHFKPRAWGALACVYLGL